MDSADDSEEEEQGKGESEEYEKEEGGGGRGFNDEATGLVQSQKRSRGGGRVGEVEDNNKGALHSQGQ